MNKLLKSLKAQRENRTFWRNTTIWSPGAGINLMAVNDKNIMNCLVTTMNYLVITAQLMCKLCGYERKEWKCGPTQTCRVEGVLNWSSSEF